MQGGARGRELGETSFDRGVDVLVGRSELELARVQLALDLAKSALDRGQLRLRHHARGGKAAGVRDATRDVIRVKLVVDGD